MDELIAALCFQLPTGDDQVDGWYRLIPAPGADGVVRGKDGRIWRMSDPQRVAAAFTHPLPVDVNHAEELKAPAGETVPAYAWIEKLEAREDGIYGQLTFNERGAAAVRNREYRFLSPVFSFDKRTREIARLHSASLVNSPNFALALNRRQDPNPDDEQESSMNLLQKLIDKLGLADDATEEQALNRVAEIRQELETATNRTQELEGELETARNRPEGTPSLEKYVPRADYDQVAERARNAEQRLADMESEREEAEIEEAINGALEAGKITPATVEYHKAQCRAEGGLDRFKQFLESAPVIAEPSQLDGKKRGADVDEHGLTAEQRALCRDMGLSEKAYAEELKSTQEAAA